MEHHDGRDRAAEPFPLLGVGAGQEEVIGEATEPLEFGDGELALLGRVDYAG
jgi:hypothetical protein